MGSGFRRFGFALPLVIAFMGCAHVDPDREVLRSLRVEGNDSLSSSAIEERLALDETPSWPWAEPRYFDSGTLVGDRRRLLRFYQANGFYDARVRSRLNRKDNGVHVTFIVNEGQPTLVSTMDFVGLDELPADVRRSLLSPPKALSEGERISEEAYDRLRSELVQRLRNHGYADAVVIGEVSVDPENHQATVHLLVEPGQRLRFGRVVVSGAVNVPRARILERVVRAIPPGSRYSDTRLEEAQTELFDMGVFGGVRVSRGPTDESTGTVPVVVSVSEAPFQTIRAGAGAGLDPQRYEARVSAEYEHRNFLGGLRTLRFENRLGYAILSSEFGEIADQGIVGSSAIDLTQPRLFRNVDGNIRIEYEHGLEVAYGYDVISGRLGFPIRLHRSLTFTPSYNLQRFWLQPTDGGVQGDEGNCQLEQGDCVLAYLEERLAWDRRNHPLETRSGWYAALALQQGRSWLGSQSTYDRLLAETRFYVPLPASMVLALRLQAGALYPEGPSPIMVRFYEGGGNSVRSFGTRRLAPQDLRKGVVLNEQGQVVEKSGKTRSLEPKHTVPIGGDALIEATAELRTPIVGDLGAAFFVDAGNVSRFSGDGPNGFEELFPPNVAVGLGLRYRTPFGPIRLDAAYRVVSNLPCVATDCNVKVPESPFALHFAIGEAF